jgi:hypothetical protein
VNTALAITTLDAGGKVIPGVIALLRSPQVPGGILGDISNNDGYMIFEVPMPFSGVLHLGGAAQFYEQAISVNGTNVTIRVGGGNHNPQDLMLPACVPFV